MIDEKYNGTCIIIPLEELVEFTKKANIADDWFKLTNSYQPLEYLEEVWKNECLLKQQVSRLKTDLEIERRNKWLPTHIETYNPELGKAFSNILGSKEPVFDWNSKKYYIREVNVDCFSGLENVTKFGMLAQTIPIRYVIKTVEDV